jgi:uncharacterized protein YcfL
MQYQNQRCDQKNTPIVYLQLLLSLCLILVINTSLAQDDQDDLWLEEDGIEIEDEDGSYSAEDFALFEVPPVQMLLMSDSLSGITMNEVFSDEINGRKFFEIEIGNTSFKEIKVQVKFSWYDKQGQAQNTDSEWQTIKLYPNGMEILEAKAPSLSASELIIHMKP